MAFTAPPSWYLVNTYTQIKRRASGTTDKYGNDVYTTTEVQVSGCCFDPKPVTSIMYAGRMEVTDREEHVTEFGILMIADPLVDLEPEDGFIIDGDAYEVLGPVERHTGSRMGNDYALVPLSRVTG